MNLYEIRNELNKGVPLTKLSLKVTDYARVSTDHLEQKKSLQNQTEHFEEYIKSIPTWTYIKGYVDDGISGTSVLQRENFLKMIEDAKKGKFDLIITKEISRFSRNTLDSIKYTRELLSYGVPVLFMSDNINTALPDAELRLTIMASMAQDEIRRLSSRVKFGMNHAIQKGEILGNDLLYGYKKNKLTGNLEIIETEAKIVRRIYELYVINEYSLSKISKTLNQENIKTSLNKRWNTTTISRMIENPKYKGYYCAHKSEIINYMTKEKKHFDSTEWIMYENKEKIPQIIDEILWNKANERLIKRKKTYKERKKEENIHKSNHLYSSKIFCKSHNALFYRRQFRKVNKDASWVCSEYLKKGKNSCFSPNIRESELTYIFTDIIKLLNLNINKIKETLIKEYNNIRKETTVDINKITKIKEKKEKLLLYNLEGNITKEEFLSINKKLTEELNNLKKELKKPKDEKQELINLEKHINEKITALMPNKIIDRILNKIYVYKEKDIINLEIYLNYKAQKETVIKESYEFKRGYDTKGTKRYKVKYEVKCFF